MLFEGGSRTESSDLLSVLDELNSDTFSDGRVGLFGFDADFFKHDALGVRGTSEGRGLVGGSEESLLVVKIGPSTFLAGGDELTGGVKTAGLASVCHFCDKKKSVSWCGILSGYIERWWRGFLRFKRRREQGTSSFSSRRRVSVER